MAVFLDMEMGEDTGMIEFFDLGIGMQADMDHIPDTSCFEDEESRVFEGDFAFYIGNHFLNLILTKVKQVSQDFEDYRD